MPEYTHFINDEQWKKIEPLLPKPRAGRVGRPPADNREVLEGILWILRTGARWKDLPKRYPSASTCWRRLNSWEERGVWLKVWRKFLGDLDENSLLDWEEAFIDGIAARDCARDGGLAPRSRLAGVGHKPPQAAVVKSHGGER